jgi:hypothetical protein
MCWPDSALFLFDLFLALAFHSSLLFCNFSVLLSLVFPSCHDYVVVCSHFCCVSFPSLLLYFFISEYILLLVFFLQYSFPVFHTIISFVSCFLFYSFIPVFSSSLIFLSFLCSFFLPILVSLLSLLSSFLSLFLYVCFLVLVCAPAFHLLAAVALSPCSHAHRLTASLCCTRRPVGYFTTLIICSGYLVQFAVR